MLAVVVVVALVVVTLVVEVGVVTVVVAVVVVVVAVVIVGLPGLFVLVDGEWQMTCAVAIGYNAMIAAVVGVE